MSIGGDWDGTESHEDGKLDSEVRFLRYGLSIAEQTST